MPAVRRSPEGRTATEVLGAAIGQLTRRLDRLERRVGAIRTNRIKSPDGTVWRITVDNLGNVSAERAP